MVSFFRKHIGIKNLIFAVIAILFLIFLTQIKDIAILFFASFVISCSLNPIVNKLCDKYKKLSRTLVTTIVLVITLLLGFMFLIPIIIVGGHQISSFLAVFPEYFENAKHFIISVPALSSVNLESIGIGNIVSSATGFTTNIVNSSIMFSKGIASSLIYFLAACIIIYYFIADKDTIKSAYLSLFPKNIKKHADEILESISQKVGGYVLAQIVTMASVGLIVLVGLAIIGVDYALILGLITAVFDIVPVVGPAVALVILILAVCKMGALKIGLTILIFILAQWAENNLIRPYIFGKLLNLHPLIIYFFLLVTAQFLGVIGLIFAPAIAAMFCVLIEELYIKNIN